MLQVLIGTLTVYETINFAAQLRLPTSKTVEERAEIVENVLVELGLDVARDTYIGLVTESQRRGYIAVSNGKCTRKISPILLFAKYNLSCIEHVCVNYHMQIYPLFVNLVLLTIYATSGSG